MKKLSLYVVLGLLWCNVGVAESKSDDLTGKQLLCTYIDSYNSSINTIEGFKFVSPNNVELYGYYVFEDRFFEKPSFLNILLDKSFRVILLFVIN